MSTDYAKMKVADLRAECTAQGLDKKGRKAELVARLEAAAAAAAAASSSSSSSSSVNYAKMKVAQLRDECTARGLSSKGKKAELVKRLKSAAKGSPKVGAKRKRGGSSSSSSSSSSKKKTTTTTTTSSTGKKPAKTQKTGASGTAGSSAGGGRTAKVDPFAKVSAGGFVVGEYDALLNQVNVKANNNKFYKLQVIEDGGQWVFWTRWGRVGEDGQNKKVVSSSLDGAVKAFKKKFRDKTRNAWDERDNFVPVKGKYTLMMMADDDEDDDGTTAAALQALDGEAAALAKKSNAKVAPSALPKPLQETVKLIFDEDMFKHAMAEYKIDTKKMPLGKIASSQIEDARAVLDDLKAAVDSGNRGVVADLSSTFYTLVPHSFGRSRPPALNTVELIQNKMQMLDVLLDIEKAQKMLAEGGAPMEEEDGEDVVLPNPLDEHYATLNADLGVVPKGSDEFKWIEKYTKSTMGRSLKIVDVFSVDRDGADDRFAQHDELDNRKLLWHGTSVAVVAAIIKSGIRIMPSAGGRVGKGAYFASENAKSAAYVRPAGNRMGYMFLAEVALGKEHTITVDDWSIRAPPKGYDSIVARGRQEPNPTGDIVVQMGGKDVVVPQSAAIPVSKYANSRFRNSEYLVYKESQVRLRYLLKMKF